MAEPVANCSQSICYVTRKWPPAVGGMETYSIRLCESLAKFCKITTLALPGRPDGSPPSSLRLIRFGIATAVRLLLTRTVADVTHIGDMALWPLALAACLRSRRSRIAISAHGTDVSFPRRGGLRGRLYGAYMRLATALLPGAVVIANSQATENAAKELGFRRLVVVPLATNIRTDPPGSCHSDQILFVGRLTPRKGCAWFIREVLPLLPDEITLRVAGTVWEPGEAEALNSSRVDFLGPIRGDALIREYASALCVVVPNIDMPNGEFEGFGLTAAEASAAGGIVLAAEHSGLKEALIDGETGFHLSSGNAAGWAGKISEIRNWPGEKRAEFVRKAVETTRRIYSWDRVARETVAAYALAR